MADKQIPTWEEMYPLMVERFIPAGVALNISPAEMAREFLEQQVQAGKVLPKQTQPVPKQ